jgi:hypothetical protein
MAAQPRLHARGLTAEDREFDNLLRCAAQRCQHPAINLAVRPATSQESKRGGQPDIRSAAFAARAQ